MADIPGNLHKGHWNLGGWTPSCCQLERWLTTFRVENCNSSWLITDVVDAVPSSSAFGYGNRSDKGLKVLLSLSNSEIRNLWNKVSCSEWEPTNTYVYVRYDYESFLSEILCGENRKTVKYQKVAEKSEDNKQSISRTDLIIIMIN